MRPLEGILLVIQRAYTILSAIWSPLVGTVLSVIWGALVGTYCYKVCPCGWKLVVVASPCGCLLLATYSNPFVGILSVERACSCRYYTRGYTCILCPLVDSYTVCLCGHYSGGYTKYLLEGVAIEGTGI